MRGTAVAGSVAGSMNDNSNDANADDEIDGVRASDPLKSSSVSASSSSSSCYSSSSSSSPSSPCIPPSAWSKLVQDTRDFWGCGTCDGAEEEEEEEEEEVYPSEETEGVEYKEGDRDENQKHTANQKEDSETGRHGGEGGGVLRLKRAPTALEFARMVLRNQPVVFEGLCAGWDATRCWSREYLEQRLGEAARVNVAVTPNGLGDAVTNVDEADLCFAPQKQSGEAAADEASSSPRPRPGDDDTSQRGTPSVVSLSRGEEGEGEGEGGGQRLEEKYHRYPKHLTGGKYFVQPEERQMTMAEFFRMLLREDVPAAAAAAADGGGAAAGVARCSRDSGTPQAPTSPAAAGTAAAAAAAAAAAEGANARIAATPSDNGPALSATKEGGGQQRQRRRRRWSSKSQVAYLSYQNDSFREQFAPLQQDVPPSIDFAAAAFGNEPDAVNLWIGNERAVTTTHVDHYENMYAVVEGEKHFHLLPPPSGIGLYEREFPAGRFRFDETSGRWKVEVELEEEEEDDEEGEEEQDGDVETDGVTEEPDAGQRSQSQSQRRRRRRRLRRVPWIELDPAAPDLKRFPRFRTHCVKPLHCVVRKGDVLYLPALWYHRVAQRGVTIAVNYWHDMEFMGPNFVYTSFLREIAAREPPDNSL